MTKLTGDKGLQTFENSDLPENMGVLAFEASDYMEYASDLELTEAQKTEFLQTLWYIMAAFVNAGFGVDSVIPMLTQNTLENCADAVEETIPTHEFNVAAESEEIEG